MGAPTTNTCFVGDMSRCRSRVNVFERLRPEFFDRELKNIFRRAWLPVARVADLKEVNSFVAIDVPPLKASLLVMRGPDSRIRAFHNACRHRGNLLVPNATNGCKAALNCRFHGWGYATDGRLIAVTDRTQFPGLKQEESGLIPVHAQIWEDFVFVNFDPNPSESLRDWLGKFYDEYTGYFADRQRLGSYRIEVDCNWNLATNSFSEGYHSGFLHKASVPDYQGGTGNPMRHRPYLEVTARHGRYSAKSNPNHKMTPVEQLAFTHGRKLFPAFPHISELGVQPPGVNPGRNEWWAFDVVELFPCTILLLGAYWHATMWFWPLDEGRTDIRIDYFGYEAKTVGDHLAHAYFRVRNREVFREDVGTMEACGRTLGAGWMQEIVLSQQEMLIQNHYAVASEMIGPPSRDHDRAGEPAKVERRSAKSGGETHMKSVGTLPPEFAELQPLMAEWCLANERDRYLKLMASSIAELQLFFDAVSPRSEEITARLSAKDLKTLSTEDRNLFWLLMTFVETAHPIELKWKKTDVEDSFGSERLLFGPSSCESPI